MRQVTKVACVAVWQLRGEVVANLRTGHSGVDGRFASVYFDPKPGNELSAVFGCSYNCANQFTYQNASSSTWHGAPRILGEAVQAISAGCCYQRSGARGFGDRLGRFGSRAIGAWPQLIILRSSGKPRRSVFAAPAGLSKKPRRRPRDKTGLVKRFSAQRNPTAKSGS
jgi:hypothetical protein